MEDAFRLALADQAGDEVVHLAHVAAEMATELGILGGLAERLDPQLGHLEFAVASRDVTPPHRLERLADVCRRPEGLLPRRTSPAPHVVERGEIEVALRPEVAVEDRLRDAGGPRDLGRRRAAIAAFGEDADRRLDQRLAALGRRHPGWGNRQAASSSSARTGSGR